MHVIQYLVLLVFSLTPDARNAFPMPSLVCIAQICNLFEHVRGEFCTVQQRGSLMFAMPGFLTLRTIAHGRLHHTVFFEASQYPLMICADLRCCHCLWAYSKAQMACKCFHGQPGTVQIFLKPSGDPRYHLKRKAFQNHLRREVFQEIFSIVQSCPKPCKTLSGFVAPS